MSNGSTELITWMDHLWFAQSVAIPIPTFGRWTDQPMETGNPNNPDGGYLPRREIIRFMDELADLDLVVIDESFIDFVDAEPDPSVALGAAIRPNVVVLKSLGKNFGLHGIRFGYLVANPGLAATMRSALPKWNLNALAETVVFMLKEHEAEYHESLRLLARDRYQMGTLLARLPQLVVYPSQANFLLVKLSSGVDGTELRDDLIARHQVFIRECGNKLGMSNKFVRLVVRPQQDVTRLVTGILNHTQPHWDDELARRRQAARSA